MAWPILFIAGLFEILWAWAMKQSAGFSRIPFVILMVVAMIVSFWLLAIAMRDLPLGTAYAVWTGIGVVGAFVIGIAFLGESATPLRLVAAGLIIAGLILMKFASD